MLSLLLLISVEFILKKDPEEYSNEFKLGNTSTRQVTRNFREAFDKRILNCNDATFV